MTLIISTLDNGNKEGWNEEQGTFDLDMNDAQLRYVDLKDK